MSLPNPDPASDERLAAEATTLLQQLIRFNTVNPPGDEDAAQRFLAARLRRAGFAVNLLGAEPHRPNLIAELGPGGAPEPGEQPGGPVLTLLSHIDTVLADPADWQHDPWSGDLVEGLIWGRGAIDMKSQTAAEIAAACGLAEAGWRPAEGLLRIVVCVDEEVGGTFGARWLCEEHPALVRSDIVINEGGGAPLVVGDRRFHTVGVGEKGVCRFLVRTRGRAAHASTPGVAINAMVQMVPVIQRLADAELPVDLTDAPRALLGGLGLLEGEATPQQAVERLRELAPHLAPLIEPMLRVTVAPTMIGASQKINVVPGACELRVDCRIPPGMDAAAAQARVRELLDGLDVELEFDAVIVGNGSPVDGPVPEAIAAWLTAHDPDAAGVVPTILPGFTDSRWFREAFPECRSYGFFPHRHMTLDETYPLMHAADERIDQRDLAFAAQAYRDLVKTLLGDADAA